MNYSNFEVQSKRNCSKVSVTYGFKLCVLMYYTIPMVPNIHKVKNSHVRPWENKFTLNICTQAKPLTWRHLDFLLRRKSLNSFGVIDFVGDILSIQKYSLVQVALFNVVIEIFDHVINIVQSCHDVFPKPDPLCRANQFSFHQSHFPLRAWPFLHAAFGFCWLCFLFRPVFVEPFGARR